MADNSGWIKVAAVGVAAYVAYTQGWLSFLGIGAPAATSTPATSTPATTTPATTTAVATTAPSPNAISGANSAAGIQAHTIALANAPAAGLGVDQWGYYLNQVLNPLNMVAPDPMPLFTAAAPGFDRSQVLTSGQYWAVMLPALKSQLGFTGLGLYWVTA
jgi:hypothetical protein